jgi:hypothetical protein
VWPVARWMVILGCLIVALAALYYLRRTYSNSGAGSLPGLYMH